MRVLTVTNMYPTTENPQFGIFVKEQVESIRALGVDVDLLFMDPRRGRLRHKAYLFGIPRVWAQLRRSNYDVVHAHYVLSGMVARCQWSVPLVVTHHGIELVDPAQGRLCRWTRNWPDRTIVVAEWMRRLLDLPEAAVIPCGIDQNLFRPLDRMECRRTLGLDLDRRYILFAGEWWRPEKRFHLVEAAMQQVQAQYPEIELLRIGQEPHARVPIYMNAADALVLVSTFEGSPMVVKEAMACGLPVLCTEAGDAWDVIGDTPGCARLTSDPEEITGAIVRAVVSPRRTTGPTRTARYGLLETARAVVGVYQQAIAAIPSVERIT